MVRLELAVEARSAYRRAKPFLADHLRAPPAAPEPPRSRAFPALAKNLRAQDRSGAPVASRILRYSSRFSWTEAMTRPIGTLGELEARLDRLRHRVGDAELVERAGV